MSSFQLSLTRVEDVRVSLETLPERQPATPSMELYAYAISLQNLWRSWKSDHD